MGVPLALHHVPILPSASRWHLPRLWAGDRDSPSCSAHCYQSLWRGHPGAGASASCHRLSPPLRPPARAIAPGTQKEADLKPARARAECRSLAKSRLCSRRGVGCPSTSTHGDCAGAGALSGQDLGLPPTRCPGSTLSPRGPWSRLQGGLRRLSAPRRALGRDRLLGQQRQSARPPNWPIQHKEPQPPAPGYQTSSAPSAAQPRTAPLPPPRLCPVLGPSWRGRTLWKAVAGKRSPELQRLLPPTHTPHQPRTAPG